MYMTGEIGKFVLHGEQVGGFRNWTALVQTVPPIRSRVIASGFWMFRKVNIDRMIAFFYSGEPSFELVLEKEATIKLPDDYPLDRLVISPIEMTFDDDFDWRD